MDPGLQRTPVCNGPRSAMNSDCHTSCDLRQLFPLFSQTQAARVLLILKLEG